METAAVSIAEQYPIIGAFFVLVVGFVWYLDRKDKQFMSFLREEREERKTNNEQVTRVLENLLGALAVMHADLRDLDTYLRTSLEAMTKARARNERTRKDDNKS